VQKSAKKPLPRYRLKSKSEQSALRKLRPASGNASLRSSFQRLILSHLALIADTVSWASERPKVGPKLSEVVRDLRRRAKRVREFAEYSKSPPRLHSAGFPFLIDPPIEELLRYAASLEATADDLVKSSNNVRAIWPIAFRARYGMKGKPPRRKARRESRLIVDLLRFVKEITGEPHWEELALLLRGPCDDIGMNAARLRSLWRFYSVRQRCLRLPVRMRRFALAKPTSSSAPPPSMSSIG